MNLAQQPCKLIGPFRQIITFKKASLKGALNTPDLGIIEAGAVVVNAEGRIVDVGEARQLASRYTEIDHEFIPGDKILLPGFIDAHTHILFAGSRCRDYSMRLEGKTYLEIARAGGGIMDTVESTREANDIRLSQELQGRLHQMMRGGVTTAEVKTGYGLNVTEELRLLEILHANREDAVIDIIPTCLAAHMKGPGFTGSNKDYLDDLEKNLFPVMDAKALAGRVDIFVESSAFTVQEARPYLQAAQKRGWDITVHADQFTSGGLELAVSLGALSADHLEASSDKDIQMIAGSNTIATVLPGASLGLGICFAPARKLLDAGASVAIASDWNPGSAPMGSLLTAAALLGVYQKLTMAETFAGLTFRAAAALRLFDRGRIVKNAVADMQAYDTSDFRDILYYQGALKPSIIWTKSKRYDQ